MNNPQILELGIGKLGINAGIMSVARFCIYFSAAQRVLEFIFSSTHDVATFIGNITMDVAKTIVTIFMTKIAVAIGAGLGATFGMVVPISVGIGLIVCVGFIITTGLLDLDEKYNLSTNLIESIRNGVKEYQKIVEWNLQHKNPYAFSRMSGY